MGSNPVPLPEPEKKQKWYSKLGNYLKDNWVTILGYVIAWKQKRG